MLELARHAELHAAGVIEYFDNFDEHSEARDCNVSVSLAHAGVTPRSSLIFFRATTP